MVYTWRSQVVSHRMLRVDGGCEGTAGLRWTAVTWIASEAHLERGALVDGAPATPAGHRARV